jgi:putative ABC transport system ATP-binding protein
MNDRAKPIIEMNGVTKTFVMGEVTVPVLRGVDLDILPRELTVILGPSGSGKTTLLNLIGGIDRPTDGRVVFDGQDISELDDDALTAYRRKQVGFVFQFYNLVPSLTARENVQVATEIADDPMDTFEALKQVGLEDRVGHFPSQMSGGQQQRVAIARALAKRPKLMLCDEPTGALDKETSVLVLDLLSKLNETLGATIIIITHAAQIAQMAHRIISVDSGRVTTPVVNLRRLSAGELRW